MFFVLYLFELYLCFFHDSLYAVQQKSSFLSQNTFYSLYEYAPAEEDFTVNIFLDFLGTSQKSFDLESYRIFLKENTSKLSTHYYSSLSGEKNRSDKKKNNLDLNTISTANSQFASFLGFTLESSFWLRAFLLFSISFVFELFRRKKLRNN